MKKNVVGQVTVLAFVLVAIFGACSPSLPDYTSDYDLVYTKEAKGFDFGTVHTYFLPDTLVSVAPVGEEDHKWDALILSTLKTNLDALGWTQLPEDGPTKADIVVLPSSTTQNFASCAYYCWYCYWGWYPGWGYYPPAWGPGWGWGYPTDIVCATYSTGTVSVVFTNPNVAADNKLPIVWLGILNGLTEGSDSNVQARITKNMNQMFIQSPYLKP